MSEITKSGVVCSALVLALLAAPTVGYSESDGGGSSSTPPDLMYNASGTNASDAGKSPVTADSFAFPEVAVGGVSGDTLSAFGTPSGTTVSKRATELRDDVLRLRTSVNMNANEFSSSRAGGAAGAVQYHSTVAAITARLQNGTTRGNPILLRQWAEAEGSLGQVTGSLERLNNLQTAVASDASLASYLLESVQAAFQLSGAVDEDHDQLKILRDEVSRMVVQLDYLRNQVADDIQRQTAYLTAERTNLQSLAFAISRGELLGNSLSSRPIMVKQSSSLMMMPESGGSSNGWAAAPMAAPVDPVQSSSLLNSPEAPTAGKLLVLIRYNQPNVEYEQQLSRAVGAALQRKPDAEFSIVAVSPTRGDPSELGRSQEMVGRNAESVKRSLVQLGLSPSKIAVTDTQASSAQVPEVHVYVR